MGKNSFYEKYTKRALDILFSALILLLFCWLYAIVAILVRVKLGSPVIFHQERPGKDGEIFELVKFRSMTDERDENGELLPDEVRLTKFGKWLRSTSLDELPELWNILKGEMSFVGPRPLLVRYLPYYTEEESHRHDVRPGLTGLAQVNGRNALAWDSLLAYDVVYVRKISLAFDIKILLDTVLKVVKRSDILVAPADHSGRLDIQRKRGEEQ